MTTLRHVGTSIFGHPVYTGMGMFCDAAPALLALVEQTDRPAALLWNGVVVTGFRGMCAVELQVAYAMATDSARTGGWPRQTAPFSPEVDPFKVARLPDPEESPDAR